MAYNCVVIYTRRISHKQHVSAYGYLQVGEIGRGEMKFAGQRRTQPEIDDGESGYKSCFIPQEKKAAKAKRTSHIPKATAMAGLRLDNQKMLPPQPRPFSPPSKSVLATEKAGS
jgi:hypothetical protein